MVERNRIRPTNASKKHDVNIDQHDARCTRRKRGEITLMARKIKKWLYLYVVQGYYGYGWGDLVTHENRIDALNDYKWYEQNEQYPHRIIKRRTLRKKN